MLARFRSSGWKTICRSPSTAMTSSVRAGCTTSPGSTDRESTTPSCERGDPASATRRTFAPASWACAWRSAVSATRESAPIGADESCCASAAFFCARASSTARRALSSSVVGHRAARRELRRAIEVGLRAFEVRLGLAQPLGRDDRADASQLVDPRAGLVDGGLGLRDRRARLGVVDLHEQVARLDVLPLDRADRDDEPRELRRHLHARRHPDASARDDVLLEVLLHGDGRADDAARASAPRRRRQRRRRGRSAARAQDAAGVYACTYSPLLARPMPRKSWWVDKLVIPVDHWPGRATVRACSSRSHVACSPPRCSISCAGASSAESFRPARRFPPSAPSPRCSRSIATPCARG